MELFLDTTDKEEVLRAAETGFLAGVTTNPSLLSKTAGVSANFLRDLAAATPGPISFQVCAQNADDMVQQGLFLSSLAPNVVVKIPLSPAGLNAAQMLVAQGAKVNVTFCFSVAQALLVARAGATFISPFMGRLEDQGGDGARLISDIHKLYEAHGFETAVLAASVRSVTHVEAAALAGADYATLPPKIFWSLVQNPLTDKAEEDVVGVYADLTSKIFPA